jgi:predicted nucleic acid-binding protein
VTTSTPSASTASAADASRTFVDTNVLIYAHDPSETIKQPVATVLLGELWATRSGTMSTQVLQEFYYTVTRKVRQPLAPADAREVVAQYTSWPIVIIGPSLILSASKLHEQHSLSFWDALIVEAARVAGAGRLLTEDMQHGRLIEGVRIENPFMAGSQPDLSDGSNESR